jgi:hypothetical protein
VLIQSTVAVLPFYCDIRYSTLHFVQQLRGSGLIDSTATVTVQKPARSSGARVELKERRRKVREEIHANGWSHLQCWPYRWSLLHRKRPHYFARDIAPSRDRVLATNFRPQKRIRISLEYIILRNSHYRPLNSPGKPIFIFSLDTVSTAACS